MSKGTLYTNIQKGIATITFGHPKSNSFPSELLNQLIGTFNRLSDDDQVNVIVLKSEGERAFCSGASFDELLKINTLEDGQTFFEGFANLINAMRQCTKTIVTRVQGKTVGGGVGIIAASDYVFATEKADIKLSEISIGIGPFVIEPAITRKIGMAALNELSLEPWAWKTAYWAQKKGLFAKVFDNTYDLDRELEIYTNKLASYNPEALANWKKISWQGTEHWVNLLNERAAISGELVLSGFTKKALEKFRS